MPLKEFQGDIFRYLDKGYWVVITTNGMIDSKGHAVMGRGIALEAAERFPDLPKKLGQAIVSEGNELMIWAREGLITLPTKHHWKDPSDIELIKQGLVHLENCVHHTALLKVRPKIVMPRLGCGAGGLKWHVVRPIIEKMTSKYSDDVAIVDSAEPPIWEFQGEYRFLSNFWMSEVAYDGMTYPSVEHAFQAAKTLDTEDREIIRDAGSPGLAKKMGRAVQLRADWEDIKVQVMTDLVWYKFSRHQDLRRKLLATGEAYLEEGNDWNDKFWGVCRGEGLNMLGYILMAARDKLQ